MINLVALEAEDLCQASSDFIQGYHRQQGFLAIHLTCHLRSCHDDWVEVVVAKLTCIMARDLRIESEDSAIGIPLPHGRGVGSNHLLRRALFAATKDGGSFRVLVGQCLLAQQGRGICLQCQCRDAAHHGICVEHLHALIDGSINIVAVLPIYEVLGVLADALRLIGVCRQSDGREVALHSSRRPQRRSQGGKGARKHPASKWTRSL
mmetsp:Transcript_110477/g.263364  ORF Transcript_110477/g.263364 Transcript_110477/m.263364 type:complete len:207 (-) Transcript_110477:15-635(-)